MKLVRAIRVLGLLLAAPLVGGWLASDRAQASCGDYVTVDGRLHQVGLVQGGLDHGMRHEPLTAPGVPQCSGPNCRRQSPMPTAPERLFDFKPHDSACGFAAAQPESPRSGTRLVEPTLLFSQAAIQPPEPPPRPLP
ncbi:MAG TPA: hypothetical protein VMV10_12210 [Pirellulales bacterium]|nr:hypothetical protein [Pirellulales bacterium]